MKGQAVIFSSGKLVLTQLKSFKATGEEAEMKMKKKRRRIFMKINGIKGMKSL